MAFAAIFASDSARSEVGPYAASKVQHELAIELARAGDYAEALGILTKLVDKGCVTMSGAAAAPAKKKVAKKKVAKKASKKKVSKKKAA